MDAREMSVRDEVADMIDALGDSWVVPQDMAFVKKHHRLYNRNDQITCKYGIIKTYVPEYMGAPDRKVLDISSGSGAFLEIMRHFGHEIMGMDIQYFPLLDSQSIPYAIHNGKDLPYPFDDKSYDLVACQGAISNYRIPWESVLGEFFRISRSCVLLICNGGHPLDENEGMLSRMMPDGWAKPINTKSVHKWVRIL